MSCLSFEFMLVGQVLLDEAACSGAAAPKRALITRPSPAQQSKSLSSSRRQQSTDSLRFYSSFLAALRNDLGFFEKDQGPAGAVCGTLYSIPEEEEADEGDDAATDDDEDDEEEEEEEQRLYALEGPLLRLFKSCFVQFAYLMPMEKASKPSPVYKTPKSLA